jgi:hypothetical protein
MRSIAAHLSLILTVATLLIATALLATGRLEYCGQPEALRPRTDSAAAETRCPTLAPPQKVVFVHVEVDKPDLEVAWAEN